METFNVIIEDVNRQKFTTYDVIPYLVKCYLEAKKKPETFEEFKKFVDRESKYQFWSRCQYEIILSAWPPVNGFEEKWDVYQQIVMNIDVVTKLLMQSI